MAFPSSSTPIRPSGVARDSGVSSSPSEPISAHASWPLRLTQPGRSGAQRIRTAFTLLPQRDKSRPSAKAANLTLFFLLFQHSRFTLFSIPARHGRALSLSLLQAPEPQRFVSLDRKYPVDGVSALRPVATSTQTTHIFAMARSRQTPLFAGLSILFYLVLLFSPLAYVQTASAQEKDPLQESYGTGKFPSSN